MLIIPAILEKTFSQAKDKITKLSPYFSRFQIDIADGKAVSNKTLKTADFKTEEFSNLTLDFHLMVKNPEKELEALERKRNINLAFIDIKSAKEEFFKTYYPFEIGITLNPEDKPEELVQKSFFQRINHVLVMTVNPGFQGSPFLPEMLPKIKTLRGLGFKGKIYLDGGINDKTIKYIKPHKDSIYALCIGSYLTKAQNPKNAKDVLNKSLSIEQV